MSNSIGIAWAKCEIDALKARVARLEDAIRYSTDYLDDYKLNSIGFRPLKTKQDIEREDAIEEMTHILMGAKNDSCSDCSKALHDAGYHNGVKVGEKVDASMTIPTTLANNMDFQLHIRFLNLNYDIFRKVEK